jgi:kelch-like protein 18
MKKSHLYLVSFIFLLLAGSCSKDNNNIQHGSAPVWKTLTPMPTAREHFGFVEVNGLFYAIGGYNASGVNAVEVYNPSDNSWQSKAPMPTARGWLAVAVVAGKIYAIGGLTGGDLNNIVYTNVTEEYDPSTNQWKEKSPFPISGTVNAVVGNQFITCTALNGKIYVAAGSAGVDEPMFIYDPVADSWQTDSAQSISKFNLVPYYSAAVGTEMYVSDGNDFLKFSSTSGNWSVLQPFLSPRLNACLASDGGFVYSLGGFDPQFMDSVSNEVEVYSPSTGTWTKMAGMNTGRHSAAALFFGANLYVVGGADLQGNFQDVPLSSMEVLQVKLNM